MKATFITDRDHQTELCQKLKEQTLKFLNNKGFETEIMEIGRDDLAFCMGCFGCWIKKPGECVINDMMAQINRNYVSSDVVIYLSPIIFGQFSANIKNALDRWLPNMLPFFVSRADGTTWHPSRYGTTPKLLIIGYGDELADEDKQLFRDITKKHWQNREVLFFQPTDKDITETLKVIELGTVGGQL